MNIAMVTALNPVELKDYLDEPEKVVSTGQHATSVHAIIRGLLDEGHQVTIVSSNQGRADEFITYTGRNLRILIVQYRHGFMGLHVVPKMRRYIREHLSEFDVLHAQWTYIYAYTILPFVDEKPCFCSVRDWCPYLMSLPCPWNKKLYQWVNYFYFRRVMASASLVKVANSHYTAERLCEWYHTKEQPIIIPNPVSSAIILNQRKTEPEQPVFISISSLLSDPRKNIGTLLKAFNRLRREYPKALLWLVGTGGRKDFEPIADTPSFFDGVTFHGKLPHDEVLNLLDASSVLVHPALEETFGNIFLEAAARCIPTIGGETSGAVPFVLEGGKAGLLCDVTSVDGLLTAMRTMMTRPEYAEELLRRSMQNIRQKYAQDVVSRKHLDIYTAATEGGTKKK